MNALAARVAAAIEQVCPIVGVRIGEAGDKESWEIEFAAEASVEQRDAALDMLDAFDAEAADSRPAPASSVADDLAALKLALIKDGITTQAKIEAAKDARLSSRV